MRLYSLVLAALLAVPSFAAQRTTPLAPLSPVLQAPQASVVTQVRAMTAVVPVEAQLLKAVEASAGAHIQKIDAALKAGEIDPSVQLRTSFDGSAVTPVDREVRVGFYPIAGDPLHWGHVIVGLQAIQTLKLDKVVFTLAGDDVRKPNMTKADVRHPMNRALLDQFAPFFDYSDLAVGTSHDGETNLFRFLALNPYQRMKAFYLVGDDHYKLTDKNGRPDTLPKLEANMEAPHLGFDGNQHSIVAAFNEREGTKSNAVPTKLPVEFLPNVPFEASSTQIRNGQLGLLPHAIYDWIKQRNLGLFGL